LNNDGKLDNLETSFAQKNKFGYKSNYDDLKKYLSSIDSAGNNPDGIITQEDKQAMYDILLEEYNNSMKSQLENMNITDDFGQNVITEQIKKLFSNKTEVSIDELTNPDGSIKDGMELFDLNGDGKLDDKEKDYFASGGIPLKTDKTTFSLNDFIETVKKIDRIRYDSGYCRNMENGKITQDDKNVLYRLLDGIYNMVDNIHDLPEETQKYYIDALKIVNIGSYQSKYSVGIQKKNMINFNTDLVKDRNALSGVMIHELTHFVLSNMSDMDALTQEVETFYMEYKLLQSYRKRPGFKEMDFNYSTGAASRDYVQDIEKLKRQNPDMSERDIAVEVFLKHKYSSYNGSYGYATKTPEEIEKSKYFDMGGIFKEN